MRLCYFIGVLSILWLPLAIPIHLILGHDPNLTTIVTMSLLFIELLFLWRAWGKFVYEEDWIFPHYGLENSPRNGRELIKGLAMGFCLCLSLFMVEATLGWSKLFLPNLPW